MGGRDFLPSASLPKLHVGDAAKVTLTRDARLATIYDARDNEVMKVYLMQALLRVQLTVVLLDEDWPATNAGKFPNDASEARITCRGTFPVE